MTTVDQIYEAIIALPVEQRTALIDRLLNTEGSDSVFSPEWRAEIKRRVAAAKSGAVGLTTWDDVRTELHSRYSTHAPGPADR